MDSGSWIIETVDPWDGLFKGQFTSLALDSGDNPHISYSDDMNGDLKYDAKSGGAWH